MIGDDDDDKRGGDETTTEGLKASTITMIALLLSTIITDIEDSNSSARISLIIVPFSIMEGAGVSVDDDDDEDDEEVAPRGEYSIFLRLFST